MAFKFKVKVGTGTPVSGALDVGEFGYDTSTERLFIGNGSNDFATAIGGELMTERVYNSTGSQLNKLAAVYVNGAQGQRLTVALARANSDATSGKTFGLVYSAIANGDEGEVAVSGLIRGVNASGSQFSETWNQGDTIYLSPSTAGALTKIKPSAPGHLVTMGFVVNNSSTSGSIFIKVSNGFELNELHDVAISNPDAGHIIIYDNVAQLWENATITAGNAITITNGAGSISIAHSDTSSQTSVDNSGVDYIQDVTLDTYGHVTGLTSATIRDASGSQSGLVNTTTQTFAGNKTFTGSLTHGGLTPSTGTNVDQLKSITFTSALTTGWTDVTGVSGTDLTTGSYIVQIESNGEYYTGDMSWFSGSTTSTVADEIELHRAGPAASAARIYARVVRVSGSTLKLQVSASTTLSSHTMTFKFRRTI